jgi:hypothetical protein
MQFNSWLIEPVDTWNGGNLMSLTLYIQSAAIQGPLSSGSPVQNDKLGFVSGRATNGELHTF